MTTKRVLVTGGPGFIGRRVVQRFLDAGWNVTSFSLPGEQAAAEWHGPVRMAYGDIGDPDAIGDAVGDCDLVIHLAAVVGLSGDYDRQWAVIAEGTRNLCKAASATGCRLVVVSSIAVYGDLIQRQVCHEDDGYGAWQGAYGRAKQAQEQIALDIAARSGTPLTLIRPANVYGIGGGSAWGDRLIDAIREHGSAMFGAARTNDAGLVHVENLADALLLAGTRPEAVGRVYNVCDQNGVTWERFMLDMAAFAGRTSLPTLELGPVLAAVRANENPARLEGPRDAALPSLEGLNLVGFSNLIDSSRIRSELGWRPRLNYAAALAAIAEELGRPLPPSGLEVS